MEYTYGIPVLPLSDAEQLRCMAANIFLDTKNAIPFEREVAGLVQEVGEFQFQEWKKQYRDCLVIRKRSDIKRYHAFNRIKCLTATDRESRIIAEAYLRERECGGSCLVVVSTWGLCKNANIILSARRNVMMFLGVGDYDPNERVYVSH